MIKAEIHRKRKRNGGRRREENRGGVLVKEEIIAGLSYVFSKPNFESSSTLFPSIYYSILGNNDFGFRN